MVHHIFPARKSWVLDNILRRWLHDPRKILQGHIKEGMTALDIGCGTGVFTIEMARMVGNGKVIAADLQQEMLSKVKKKITKDIAASIELHKCEIDSIGIGEKIDFALAFYMVHEVHDQIRFFEELHSILKKGGKLLMIEPKFEVSADDFKDTLDNAVLAGFRPVKSVGLFFSMGELLEKD